MELIFLILFIWFFIFLRRKLHVTVGEEILLLFGSLITLFFLILSPKKTVLALLLIFLIFFIRERKSIHRWKRMDYDHLDPYRFSDDVERNVKAQLTSNDADWPLEAMSEKISYPRVLVFAQDSPLLGDQDGLFPIYYWARPADNELSFQEYGILVLTSGIVINTQARREKRDQQNKDDKFFLKQINLPFQGLYDYHVAKNHLFVMYSSGKIKVILIQKQWLELLELVLDTAIDSGWTQQVQGVLTELAATMPERAQQQAGTVIPAMMDLDGDPTTIDTSQIAAASVEVDDQAQAAEARQNDAVLERATADAMLAGSISNRSYNLHMNQTNDRFGGGQGHGVVGEAAGHERDSWLGRKATRLGGTHEKHGADRIVNGRYVQTKYCATAGKTVGQIFTSDGQAIYLHNGRMMVVEVPKDQYEQSIALIRKRIAKGQVPNETDPNNAALYVKKGAMTYEHAKIATKSIFDRGSTITVRENGQMVVKQVTFGQKLVYSAGFDFVTGVRLALPASTVMVIWISADHIWHGESPKEAVTNALALSIKPIITSGFIYMTASQFSGSQMGKGLAKSLSNGLGRKVGTETIAKGTMIAVTAAITVGPDVIDYFKGQISMQQLVKNTLVTGAGAVGGAAIGSVLGTMIAPGIGSTIGAMIGGSLTAMGTKKILDHFSEDDAVLMIRITKEEFIAIVLTQNLSTSEFTWIAQEVFMKADKQNLFKVMFAQENHRGFIRDYLTKLLDHIFQERESIEQPLLEQVSGKEDQFFPDPEITVVSEPS
ncbi:hypothetical protein [Lapidilactobacillus luobeiensis]|uniref:hypothetical protein n=1 Tax=Lapidilactobacillus luobeiensis TaxID=2950371 RepID=UPI0021C39AD7|nr:hypothetical protein [Lapidilactobacillus luobeiensis]